MSKLPTTENQEPLHTESAPEGIGTPYSTVLYTACAIGQFGSLTYGIKSIIHQPSNDVAYLVCCAAYVAFHAIKRLPTCTGSPTHRIGEEPAESGEGQPKSLESAVKSGESVGNEPKSISTYSSPDQ